MEATAMPVDKKAAEIETDDLFQVIHLFFQDSHQGDHHLTLTVTLKPGEGVIQAKRKAEDKADWYLKSQKADRYSMESITQEEYEQSPRFKQKIFHIVYQNGKRRCLGILAIDEAEAEQIFCQRAPSILFLRVFDRQGFKEIMETGAWKHCPLLQAGQN
jgi:hypothetical protein